MPAQPWAALEERWLPRLPAAKRASVLRLRAAVDRNSTLLGIALLARALGRLGLERELGALEFPRHGKPHFADGPDFSVSHAGGLVACALATRGCVGLDLEPTAAVRETTVARVLSEDERARLARAELSPADAWVSKEAVVKAAGRGVGAMRAVVLAGRRARLEGTEYRLRRVALARSHTSWLALAGPPLRVVLHPAPAAEFAPLPRGG